MHGTCLSMLPAVGAWIQVRFESLWIECEVVDVKTSWGKPRLWVTPLAGEGCQWVELSRVRHIERLQPATERTLHSAAS